MRIVHNSSPLISRYVNFCSKNEFVRSKLANRIFHPKRILGYSKHSNKLFLTSNMPYALKYLKSNVLHLKRSLNTLKSLKQDLLHLKGALHSQIPKLKSSPPQE